MAGRGVGEEVALVGRGDGKVERGILSAERFDEDDITVDARGGGITVELFVDSVRVEGGSQGGDWGRGRQG